MKRKSTNKAIQGRRNRWHPMPMVFRYDPYDEQTRMELKKVIAGLANTGFAQAMIPKNVEVLSFKRPRIINYQAEPGLIEGLVKRVMQLEDHIASIKPRMIAELLFGLDANKPGELRIREILIEVISSIPTKNS